MNRNRRTLVSLVAVVSVALVVPSATAATKTTKKVTKTTKKVTKSTKQEVATATTNPVVVSTTIPKPAVITKVNIGCAPTLTGLPFDYAIKNGIDKANGVDMSCIAAQTGPQLTAALLSGDINVSGFNPANIFPVLDGGADLVGFQSVLNREFFDIIVRKDFPLPSSAEGWKGVMKDLAKAKMGVVARGAAAEFVARGLYKEAGLNPDGAIYIATGLATTTLAAMQKGEIDAAMVFEPGITVGLQEGIAVQPFSIQKDTGPATLNWASLFYVTSRDFAKKNPNAIKGIQATYLAAVKWMIDPANKADVEVAIREYLKVDPLTASALLARNVNQFTTTKGMAAERYDKVGDFFFAAGLTKKAWHVADYSFNP